MSTRDQTRRELKELVKLASVLPKEHPSVPPSDPSAGGPGGSRVTVPPAIMTIPPQGTAPEDAPPAGPVSAVAMPPAVLRARGSAWTGIWAILAGGALAAAMFGGLLLGQALSSSQPASALAAPGADPAPALEAAMPAAAGGLAQAPVSPTTAEVAPSGSTVLTITGPYSPSMTFRAPRPAHHARAPLATHPPPGRDPLDDLIRKAAGN